jgi:hypothetical protein
MEEVESKSVRRRRNVQEVPKKGLSIKEFGTKRIRRLVRIPSIDPALEEAAWVVMLTASGLTIRRLGAPKCEGRTMPWKAIIGTLLVHQGR